MHLSSAEIDDLATAYLHHWQVTSGARVSEPDERAALDTAYELVEDAVTLGTLPIEVLDALVRHPEGSPIFRFYLAAGPVEDSLTKQQDRYADELATRCRQDALWTETLSGVWLSKKQWKQLPKDLRRVVPEPKSR